MRANKTFEADDGHLTKQLTGASGRLGAMVCWNLGNTQIPGKLHASLERWYVTKIVTLRPNLPGSRKCTLRCKQSREPLARITRSRYPTRRSPYNNATLLTRNDDIHTKWADRISVALRPSRLRKWSRQSVGKRKKFANPSPEVFVGRSK